MNLNKFILFLKCIQNIGDASIRKLILSNNVHNLNFTTQKEVLDWLLCQNSIFTKTQLSSFSIELLRKAKDKRLQIEKDLLAGGYQYISCFDSKYPNRLNNYKKTTNSYDEYLFDDLNKTKKVETCNDYPLILYYKGNLEILDYERSCAVVGTRQPTKKAINITSSITKKLTEMGCVIISGLATGCDAIGHETCIKNGGKTVAFLGTGIDRIYPKQNAKIFKDIICSGGLLISEYPPGISGSAFSFVERDRLQTMSSDDVYAIQTTSSGGTMHAAKATIKYKKRLFAVAPSVLDNINCDGNVVLIKDFNAKPLYSIDDIL